MEPERDPTTPPATDTVLPPGARHLSVPAFVVLVVVYLVVVQGVGILATAGMDTEYASFGTVEEVVRGLLLPVGISLVLVYAAVAVLGWWRPVLRDDRRVRGWVAAIPIIMAATIALGTNYGGLADQGLGFTVLLLAGALCVGFAEEGMFRGIGVVTFRANGLAEPRVVLWSCIVFGLAHATNLISEGPAAFVQVVVTALAGYFFYLIRRRSGGLWLGGVLHGLWDFGLLTTALSSPAYGGFAVFLLADVVLLIVVVAGRHRIEPVTAAVPPR